MEAYRNAWITSDAWCKVINDLIAFKAGFVVTSKLLNTVVSRNATFTAAGITSLMVTN